MTRLRPSSGPAPSPGGRTLPGAPSGLALARILEASHVESSGRRARLGAQAERRDAEAALTSLEPDMRESAAGTLGRLLFQESYGALLSALGSESSRSVQFALLKALADIGAEHSGRTFTEGAAPLKQLVLSRLHDPKLVAAAMEAFIWTGSSDDVIAGVRDIERAAQDSGLEVSGAVLSQIFDRLVVR